VREVLVVLFNRYAEGGAVYYPPSVEIATAGGHAVYRLVATVEHSGTLAGGHYWARALREKSARMAMLNDATATDSDDAVRPAYLVFYHFVGIRPAA
jgi:ubiquitin C-terminal hydrolase